MERTSARALLQCAGDYAAAAALIESQGASASMLPAYCLYNQAVALTLKAFLRLQGYTIDQLTDIGTDPSRLLGEAHRYGILEVVPLAAEELAAIPRLSPYSRPGGDLAPLRSGAGRFPPLSVLRTGVESLLTRLLPLCERGRLVCCAGAGI